MTRSDSDIAAATAPSDAPSARTRNGAGSPMPLALRLIRLGFRVLGTISPQLAGRWANHLWFRPPRYAAPARERELLARARHLSMAHADKQIAVYTWGDGPAVMLVHGWSGRGAQMGAFVEPLVAAGYRVIAFDAPAHGQSSGKNTNLPEVSAALQALAHEHGPVHAVIAHSFGVACTLYALDEGMRVARVVGISPPATIEGLVDKFATSLAIPPPAIKAMRGCFEARFGTDLWTRFSPLRLANKASVPALIVHDDDDSDVSWQEGEALARAWHGAQFLRTHGLGHRRVLRDSDVITQAVRFITASAT
jgi:pimeloyl-ACP methyl ester carboxylesterase